MKWPLLIRKIVVTAAGAICVVAGVAMILLPGPALVFIPLGIAILSIEYDWAKRLLRWIKEKVKRRTEKRGDAES